MFNSLLADSFPLTVSKEKTLSTEESQPEQGNLMDCALKMFVQSEAMKLNQIDEFSKVLPGKDKKGSSKQRFPSVIISDRFPFSRKSFKKHFPLEPKILLNNTADYSKQALLLFSLLGAPTVIIGKMNLPLSYHKKLFDNIFSGFDKSIEGMDNLILRKQSYLNYFFSFGLCLEPLGKSVQNFAVNK